MNTAPLTLDIPASVASAAYAGTSWTPEERGARALEGFEAELQAAAAELAKHAARGNTLEQLGAELDRFRAGFARHVRAYLYSSGRCVSAWIAGPSNFPARRMNKRAEIAHRRLNDLYEFKARAIRAAVRELRPDLRPIMAGDDNAIDRLTQEIANAERKQSAMKAANVAIRKHAKAGHDAQIAALVAMGFGPSYAAKLLEPDFCGRIGFADYQLTNNSANIRRMRARLEAITFAKAQPVTRTESANGITLEDDQPANRVRLFFPGKPAADVRDDLKRNGFRWTPTLGCWQAYRTNYRAIETARKLAGVQS